MNVAYNTDRYKPEEETMKTDERIDIPKNLSLEMLNREFGTHAVTFYRNRIEERQSAGRIYYNPLKTIYIWATQDRRTNQGYYSSYRGYAVRRKRRNFGRS